MRKANILYFVSLALVFFSQIPGYCAFVENFDDGKADKWEAISGDWKADGGEYVQSEVFDKAGGDAFNRASGYAVGNKDWTDYTFEVKIKPISSNNYAGVMFRVAALDFGANGNTFNNKSEYYYWLIGISGNYSKIWQAPACKALEETPGDTLKPNSWNKVKVEMKGQDAKLYLNDKLQKDFKFPADVQLESGGIALTTYNASASFDDVRVEGVGLAVAPKDKLATTWGKSKNRRGDYEFNNIQIQSARLSATTYKE